MSEDQSTSFSEILIFLIFRFSEFSEFSENKGGKLSFSDLNYIAVVVGAIIHMGIGFLWYGKLFSSAWMNLVGLTPEAIENSKDRMGRSYLITFALALVMAAVIQLLVKILGLLNFSEALSIGLILWLAFAGNVQLTNNLYQQKPFRLFLIDSGYFLISILVLSVLYIYWI